MKDHWQLRRLVPVALVMGIIFFLSHQEGSSLTLPEIPYIDKAAHFLLYSVLAGAALYSFPAGYRNHHPERAGLMTLLFCLVYGITDELHQVFVPGRDASTGDLIADVSGAAVTIVFWLLLRHRLNRTSTF
jgi:VanZ family protein